MKKLIMIKYGEINLKGLNRNFFVKLLINNIKDALKDYSDIEVKSIQSRLIIKGYDEQDEKEITEKLKRVFGIVYITVAYECEKDLDKIKDVALKIMKERDYKTFKVESRRSDKKFPLKSPEISREVGAHVLIGTENLKVDVHSPDAVLKVEVREKHAFVYAGDLKGPGGLPVGSSGVGGLLLSGGLDSPIASYMMNKRGMKVVAIHFHSYPYTSIQAKEKVEKLADVLKDYNMGITLINVSLTKIQEQIIEKCKGTYLTVLLRRFMIRCSEALSDKYGIQALITGESLGQVASQTIEGIVCSDDASGIPMLRPLISFDKTEIMKISRDMKAYDISILPYEDCCTIFVPKHPVIKPRLEVVYEEEEKLDIENLVSEALQEIEVINL